MEMLYHVMSVINQSPFFTSGSGPFLFIMIAGNLVVTFIIAYIAIFNATHVAEGSRFNQRATKKAVLEALKEHDAGK